MDVTVVCEQVVDVAAARAAAVAGTADRAQLETGLRSVSVVRAWLAAAEVDLAAALAGVASFPEGAVAEAGRGSQSEAGRVLERGRTLDDTPSLAGALDAGEVTAAHVDVVTKAAKGLDDAGQRAALLARADRLARFAAGASVAEFVARSMTRFGRCSARMVWSGWRGSGVRRGCGVGSMVTGCGVCSAGSIH